MTKEQKQDLYQQTLKKIDLLLDGQCDWVGAMATIVCELHNTMDHFHWTGFYRTVKPRLLQIGPYQGGHGCLHIDFENGVCGAAASTLSTQLVADVREFRGHISCSATTQSEIVVPVISPAGLAVAVLDVDSDNLEAFDATDMYYLEKLCHTMGTRFGEEAQALMQSPASQN